MVPWGDLTHRFRSSVVRVGVATFLLAKGAAPLCGQSAGAAQRSATSRVPKALPNADHLLSLLRRFCHDLEEKWNRFSFARFSYCLLPTAD
jgi:hypothetical protein